MDHKEKCRRLKAIRKKIADVIGVDLHQTECTYEGECSGTCPKCKKEEQILNKAIMGGTVMATAVLLSACGMQNESSHNNSNESSGNLESLFQRGGEDENEKKPSPSPASTCDPDDIMGGLITDYPDELTGDEYVPDDIQGGEDIRPEILEGDVEYVPVCDLTDEEVVLSICSNYSGAPYVEIDHYEGDNMIVHCYEVVDNGDESHITTMDWITVDPYEMTMTNYMGDTIDYESYYY